MATIKKSAKKMQEGGNTALDKTGNNALDGKWRKDKAFGYYKAKFKGMEEDGKGEFSERRTVKGFLKGAPKAGGKLRIPLKKGGVVKAKNGKSFPDLNKDGKITKADILKGRGVIAKKGASVKAKGGCLSCGGKVKK